MNGKLFGLNENIVVTYCLRKREFTLAHNGKKHQVSEQMAREAYFAEEGLFVNAISSTEAIQRTQTLLKRAESKLLFNQSDAELDKTQVEM